MAVHSLIKAIQDTKDLKEKVDLYNDYFVDRRNEEPLDVLTRSEQALKYGHQSAYSRGVFQVLIHRAYSFIQISEIRQAEEEIGRIKQLHVDNPEWDRDNMYFYHLLCLYYCGRTYPGLCYDYAYRSLSLARKLSDNRIGASVQDVLGQINCKLKIYHKARECYQLAMEALPPDEDVLLASMISCHRGELHSLMGETARARSSFHEGYRMIRKESSGSRGYAWVLKKFAAFEEQEGNLATAEYLYGEAVNSLEGNGYGRLAAEFRLGLGRLLLKRGKEEGIVLLNEQKEDLLRKGLYEDVLTIGDLISEYHLERENFPAAAEELKILRDISRKMLETRGKDSHASLEREQWTTARENLTRVNSLGSKLAACRNRDEIFQVLHESLGFLEKEDGLLVAEERSDGRLELIYGKIHGIPIEPRFYEHNPDTSIISYCLSRNQSLLIDDLDEEKSFFMSKEITRLSFDREYPPTLSLINVVYKRESCRGVISLQSTERKAFRFHQLEFLQSLLPFITVSLDNEQKTGMILKLSTMDSLTGLMNRREFMRVLSNSWSAHGRSGAPLSLLMIDIDFFKAINDTYGHMAGDEGLICLSRLLEMHFKRATDTCCRYGGEEFIILSGYTDEETCRSKAEDLRRDVEAHICRSGDKSFSFTISIGTVTLIPADNMSMEKFIEASDVSLYKAKKNGRNCVVSFSH